MMLPALPVITDASEALQLLFDEAAGKSTFDAKVTAQACWVVTGYGINEFVPGTTPSAPQLVHDSPRAALRDVLAPHADASGVLGGGILQQLLPTLLPIILQILQGLIAKPAA